MTAPGHNPSVHAHAVSLPEASATAHEVLATAQVTITQAAARIAAATGQLATVVTQAKPRDARFFATTPVLRRIAFVIGYEGLSLIFTIFVLGALLGHGGGESTLTAVLVTITATAWNYVWNLLYEMIERRRGMRGRGIWSRAIHAFGYEGGVLVFTVPLVAFILGVSLLEAFAIEGGLLVFFLVFTLVYTWGFDRVCGLPASAR
ncbi:putative membrane protein [Leucobacter exalbidus]|uniref:Membrane protein n=1 Tax=Leucobacter exalbidus TaxID=662960 RepID=A0A940T4G5_9MICO|nr:putative membrane protein [Leucobacter exalbidus]